ncbi:VWA domain-containing protein [Orrella marina]|uniref:VWFA domain-containing protein n=1 Tax=Orrella marina TaxID=2163011 RepID=A0A2R4XKT9_9BURK|nr:VWA domain-containing protein [Orrella marina]AWB34426.1 hypothetical protein DBV39_12715 [Orrella marina]
MSSQGQAPVLSRLTAFGVGVLMMGNVLASDKSNAAHDIMVVYDASGSMWGQIDGVTKIEIARDVMADFLDRWPVDSRLGLVAYGHRREKDCRDIETLIQPEAVDRPAFLETVNQIRPRGRTPLSAAVEHAANDLAYQERPATVVLISDGIENCQADPCALAEKLAQQGVNFTAHVIGFDVSAETQEQLACIAERTGGQFVAAKDAAQLQQAMMTVQTEIERQAVSAAPPPSDQEVASVKVDVFAPETVVAGSRFDVQWSLPEDVDPSGVSSTDRIGIAPAGAKEDVLITARRVSEQKKAQLTAPGLAGPFEVRYVSRASADVAGRAAIEVVDPDLTLTVPEHAVAGERFEVAWSETVNSLDRVGVVPSDAEPGQFGNYLRVRESDTGYLTAPSEPGSYEVRYMLSEGGATVASAPIEIIEAEVTLRAPDAVNAGSRFQVGWSETIHQSDFVTIVPQGTLEGELGNRSRVGTREQGSLTAPAEPGAYEIRYVLHQGKQRTVGRLPIAVIQSDVSLEAPESVSTGERFTVNWSDSINPNDLVTIVAHDAPDDTRGNRRRAGSGQTQGVLTAPADPGSYEVRYVLHEGGEVLARAPIEVVAATASLSAPEQVVAGSRFEIEWTETINQNDFLTIVSHDAPDDTRGNRRRAGSGQTQGVLTAPAEPGEYEVRYVLHEGGEVLARVPVTVVTPEVGLLAPASVVAGSRFEIEWTETINQNDFLTIVAHDAPDDTLGNRRRAGRGQTQGVLTAPAEPGEYEVRYVLHEGGEVLASVPVVVTEPEVKLTVPSRVRAQERFDVNWSAAINPSDTVTIVSQGSDDRETGPRTRAGNRTQGNLTAPAEPGVYEIRYIMQQGGKVLARERIEVLAKDAPL